MSYVLEKTDKYIILRVPIYRIKLYVMDIKNPVSVLAGLPIDLSDIDECEGDIANCQYVTNPETKGKHILVRLSNEYAESDLWHEGIHIASMTLEYCGIDYTGDHAEPLTYLVEWIVKMIKESFYGLKVNFNE